jgi:hypothetical protein
MGDYLDRKDSNLQKNILNIYDWQGFFTAKLGYANIGHNYPLKSTQWCQKFSSHPEKMKYRKYKCIDKLFDYSETDNELFRRILLSTYPKLETYNMDNVEMVFFTMPFIGIVNDSTPFVHKIEKYINDNFDSILIKKHPRDNSEYHFKDTMTVKEVDSQVPGEVLLPFVKGKNIVFFHFSSILLYLNPSQYRIDFLFLEDLYNQSNTGKNYLSYASKEKINALLKEYGMQDIEVINI